MPAEQRRTLQLNALRGIASFAYDNAPFYRALYASRGIDPHALRSWEDFRRLPTIRKADLKRDLAEHPIFGRMLALPEEEIIYLSSSSGTTGQPVISPFSAEEFEGIVDVSARFFYGQGIRREDRYIHCLNLSLFVASPAVLSAQRIGAATIWGGVLPVDRLAHLLRTLRVTAMLTTPSFAWRLGEHLREMGVDPAKDLCMQKIIVAGEPGGSIPATQRAIREAWGGVRLGDVYGLSEVVGCIAGSCEAQDGLHVAEDHFVMEILDPDRDEPVPDGAVGEITVTALRKKSRPMIRYRSGDYGFLRQETCACGRTHARVTVKGRLDNMFIVSGVNIFPSDVEQVVRKCPGITGEYRIRLGTERLSTCYDVEVERRGDAGVTEPEIAARLSDMLKTVLRAKPRSVIVLPENALPRDAQKTKRILDERI